MRPQGLSKLGYYPTPEQTLTELNSYLKASLPYYLTRTHEPDKKHSQTATINIVDPCCGAGNALHAIKEHLTSALKPNCNHPEHQTRVITHGIEPNQERYASAQKLLDRVIQAPIEQCRLPQEAYDLMLLNPPYDYDNEHDHKRLETYFLDITTPMLKPQGILILIIPQHVVLDASKLLATNYHNITPFRMSDPDYAQFRQSIILAERNDEIHNQLPDRYQLNILKEHAEQEANALPLNTNNTQGRRYRHEYYISPLHHAQKAPIPRITKTGIQPDAIRNALTRQSAYQTNAAQNLLVPCLEKPSFQPLEPLRRGHICLLAANGQLDNIPLHDINGELDPVIIKGHAEKILVETDHDAERDTITAQENFAAKVSVMNLRNGEIKVISENADDLTNFFKERQESIDQAVRERYTPSINPTAPRFTKMRRNLAKLNRLLLGKQAPSTIAVAAQLQRKGFCFCIAQQGVGKTTMAIGAVAAAEYQKVLVMTPSHNTDTWADEIAAVNPNAKVRKVNGIGRRGYPQTETFDLPYAETDLETIRVTPASPGAPVYAIMGKDGANKLSYPYAIDTRVVNEKRPLYRVPNGITSRHGQPKLQLASYHELKYNPKGYHDIEFQDAYDSCPHCWTPYDIHRKRPTGRQARCPTCNQPIAGPDIKANRDRAYPRAQYIAKHMPNWADLFILDEAHNIRGKNSAQAEVFGTLAQKSKRTLALTGTLMGGKASETFRLLASVSRSFYDHFSFQERRKFTETYGRYEIVFEASGNPERIGQRSDRRAHGKQPKELNGFHPSLMNHFWENTVFLRINDIKRDLPEPEIYVHLCPMDSEPLLVDFGKETTSHQDSYTVLQTALHDHLVEYLRDRRDMSPLGQYLQELLTYPENSWQGTSPLDPNSVKAGNPEPIITMPPLPKDRLYPKEQTMLEIIKTELEQGRKVLLYVAHTKNRNTAQRVLEMLQERLIRAKILPDGNAAGRLRWIQKAAPNTDVLITHPGKVETGLNLLEFPTILWYEHVPSMYTVEQASARSHRVNQQKQVRIHHLAYANTMQERYLRLIAEKADTSRMIYGEMGATGLSAFNPNSQDLRQVIAQEMMRNTRGAMDNHIDQLSETMATLVYDQETNELQEIFNSAQENGQKEIAWNSIELSAHDDSAITSAPTATPTDISKILTPTPESPKSQEPSTAPLTWKEWRESNKQGRQRQHDNQLMLL